MEKCKNYKICNSETIFGLCGLCCSFIRNTLTYSEKECPVCYDNTECVKWPTCEHYLCINCFKYCIFPGEKSRDYFIFLINREERFYKCPVCRKHIFD